MWRGGYNEDWERKKEYLIRTLFHDIPILSPVQEEEDLQNFSSLHVSPSSYRGRIHTEARRPYSPLPALIVEREPNRHDEPEEYYQRLERRMRKLYRQLFLEERSLDSSFDGYGSDESHTKSTSVKSWCKTTEREANETSHSSPCLAVHTPGPLDTTFIQNTDADEHPSVTMQIPSSEAKSSNESYDDNPNKRISIIESDSKDIDATNFTSLENEKSEESYPCLDINEGNLDLSQNKNNTNNTARNKKYQSASTSSSSSITSDPGDHYQQVTFQAEVHRESSVQDDSRLSLVYEESVCEDDGQVQRGNEITCLEKTEVSDLVTDAPKTSSNQIVTEELEVMRSVQDHCVRTSYGTLIAQPYEESSHHSSYVATGHSLEDYNSFDMLKDKSAIEVEHCSDDFDKMLHCSTPKAGNKRRSNDETGSDHISYSTKRARHEDVAIQVNEMMEWSSLRGTFFIGTPKLFRLCSCKDHSCVC